MLNNFILEDILSNLIVISGLIAAFVYLYIMIKNNSINDYCDDLEIENQLLKHDLESTKERLCWYIDAHAKLEEKKEIEDMGKTSDNSDIDFEVEYNKLAFEHFMIDCELRNLKDLLAHSIIDYDLSKFKDLFAKVNGTPEKDTEDEYMYDQRCLDFFSDLKNRSSKGTLH